MFVHGVDFSGAAGAGRWIWISSGVIYDGGLRIVETRPASELPGGSVVRDTALRALRSFIQSASGAIGLDFPFGLPRMVTAKQPGPSSSWISVRGTPPRPRSRGPRTMGSLELAAIPADLLRHRRSDRAPCPRAPGSSPSNAG